MSESAAFWMADSSGIRNHLERTPVEPLKCVRPDKKVQERGHRRQDLDVVLLDAVGSSHDEAPAPVTGVLARQ